MSGSVLLLRCLESAPVKKQSQAEGCVRNVMCAIRSWLDTTQDASLIVCHQQISFHHPSSSGSLSSLHHQRSLAAKTQYELSRLGRAACWHYYAQSYFIDGCQSGGLGCQDRDMSGDERSHHQLRHTLSYNRPSRGGNY